MRKLTEGVIYDFCFLDIDIVKHSKILYWNPLDMVEKALDEFEKYIADKVESYRGEVWSWQGDGGMCAFWGDQKSRKSVLCALDILEGLSVFNIDKDKKPINEEIKVRIGINKGTAKYRNQHGRIHSVAINFTAHLQKRLSKPNSVVISEEVYRELYPDQKEKFIKVGTFQSQEIYKLKSETDDKYTQPGIHAGERWAKSWTKEEEDVAIYSIADSIIKTGWHIDCIVAIFDPEAPGGTVVGGKLLALIGRGISSAPCLLSMCIEGRDVRGFRSVTSIPQLQNAQKILVVDDVAFTGRTLEVAYAAIKKEQPDTEIKFATLAVGEELEDKMKTNKTQIRIEFPYKVIPGNRILFHACSVK